MTDDVAKLQDAVRLLADALYPHHDDWWEDASERVNLKHRTDVNAALDVARNLGWSPS